MANSLNISTFLLWHFPCLMHKLSIRFYSSTLISPTPLTIIREHLLCKANFRAFALYSGEPAYFFCAWFDFIFCCFHLHTMRSRVQLQSDYSIIFALCTFYRLCSMHILTTWTVFSVHCNMARHADIKDFLPAHRVSKYENLQAHGNFT